MAPFRLPAHFIKINWCGKSNHIRKQHFLYNWISVVMDGAAAGLLAGQEAFNLWSLSQIHQRVYLNYRLFADC